MSLYMERDITFDKWSVKSVSSKMGFWGAVFGGFPGVRLVDFWGPGRNDYPGPERL